VGLKVAGHVYVPEEYGIGLLHRDHFARSHVCSTESTVGKRLLQYAIRIGYRIQLVPGHLIPYYELGIFREDIQSTITEELPLVSSGKQEENPEFLLDSKTSLYFQCRIWIPIAHDIWS
jgi:hypothetical protein